MATVVLGLREAYEGNLPAVCARCGAPATDWTDWTFSTGLGGLPFVAIPGVYVIAGKVRVRLPFCQAHRRHWLRRTTALLGGSLVVGLVCLVAVGYFLEHANGGSKDPKWLGLLCLVPLVALPSWLGVCVALHRTSIRLRKYDRREITLSGVADKFADAVADFEARD
jgi:hypothetical protein